MIHVSAIYKTKGTYFVKMKCGILRIIILRTQLAEKLTKQREINDSARKQLEEWDGYGAKLKSELKDVKQQLGGKSREVEEVRADLQNHKKQIEVNY